MDVPKQSRMRGLACSPASHIIPLHLGLPCADLHALTQTEYHHWLRTPEGQAAQLQPGRSNTVLLPDPSEKSLALDPPPYQPGGDARGPASGGIVQVGVRTNNSFGMAVLCDAAESCSRFAAWDGLACAHCSWSGGPMCQVHGLAFSRAQRRAAGTQVCKALMPASLLCSQFHFAFPSHPTAGQG